MIDHARDLLTIVENCETPPVVVAHSFGSHPTMLAATLLPNAFGVIGLWEPPLPWVEWWPESVKAYNARIANSEDPQRDIEAIFRSLPGGDAWEGLPTEVQELRRSEGVAFQVDMASELEAPFEFRDVGVPALVGYGTATSAAHLKGARWLAERLPAAHLHEVRGAGHFAPRTHPEEFGTFMSAAAAMT